MQRRIVARPMTVTPRPILEASTVLGVVPAVRRSASFIQEPANAATYSRISSHRVSPDSPKASETSSRGRSKPQDPRQAANASPLFARANRHAESEKTARRRSSSTIDSLARMTGSALKTTKKETGKFFTKTMGKLEKAMQSSSNHAIAHEDTDEERYYRVRMPVSGHDARPAPRIAPSAKRVGRAPCPDPNLHAAPDAGRTQGGRGCRRLRAQRNTPRLRGRARDHRTSEPGLRQPHSIVGDVSRGGSASLRVRTQRPSRRDRQWLLLISGEPGWSRGLWCDSRLRPSLRPLRTGFAIFQFNREDACLLRVLVAASSTGSRRYLSSSHCVRCDASGACRDERKGSTPFDFGIRRNRRRRRCRPRRGRNGASLPIAAPGFALRTSTSRSNARQRPVAGHTC